LLRTTTTPDAVQDAFEYLGGRHLWPLPDCCSWRAHAAAEYWHDGEMVGRFPALVAEVRDVNGELVTAHLTYLRDGRKLSVYPPRKILSAMTGRRGCAVRLMPPGEVLGIAEGNETAIAAHRLHGLPVWSALNANMLAKFYPPPGVHEVVIFADRDVAGLEAAYHLRDELDGRARVELRLPPMPHKDWNDVLEAKA
jgi:putative DNA primase/helicase